MTPPSISVVINTNGRLPFLQRTLRSLRHQAYADFEVCVVCGPTPDGTAEWVSTIDDIKVAPCADRNLSRSRNIGIALASGEIVAFIDDDAIPEPEWLADLACAYADPDIAAAGGRVYDHTGLRFQAEYVTTDRLARAKEDWKEPARHLNYPFSPAHPHLLGTNCSFRRDSLLAIGGFDEEYEYFLDETDVCCRLNDAGCTIAQLPNAYVHHKYAPSETRDVKRIVRYWYPLIKNRVYFAIRNAQQHHTLRHAVAAGLADAASWETSIRGAMAEGHYSKADFERFQQEASAAIADGMERAMAARKTISPGTLQAFAAAFQPFRTLLPQEDRRVICFVTQDYPPGQNGGIARYVHQLASSLGEAGHQVRVLTRAQGTESVDFEDDVWVHRLVSRNHPMVEGDPIGDLRVPGHIWNYSRTMLDAVRAINERRRVDAVYCPLWDCEPIAFILEGSFPVIVALQTTMTFWLESQPQRRTDLDWMRTFGDPIIAMERLILGRATFLHSISRAIAHDIERAYGVSLRRDRVGFIPLGLADWSDAALAEQTHRAPDLSILFVGRLESRKGIDVLLQAAPSLLTRFPKLVIDIVGDDTILRPDGTTYKELFLARELHPALKQRVRFHGRTDEDELRRKYRECDIFVAPSRYESFGLIFLEAMMFGKPAVGCDVGGIPEVVTHGKTGLLVPVADAVALEASLVRLVEDHGLRARMGAAARADYQRRFTPTAMRDGVLAIIDAISRRLAPLPDEQPLEVVHD